MWTVLGESLKNIHFSHSQIALNPRVLDTKIFRVVRIKFTAHALASEERCRCNECKVNFWSFWWIWLKLYHKTGHTFFFSLSTSIRAMRTKTINYRVFISTRDKWCIFLHNNCQSKLRSIFATHKYQLYARIFPNWLNTVDIDGNKNTGTSCNYQVADANASNTI